MPNSQERAAKAFAERWKNKGYEKGQSQPFWMTLLTDVFGVSNVADFIEFEDQVHIDHTSFIDGYIPSTKVLIEQKSLGKDLNAPIPQSNGARLTPFQQAKKYITELPLSRHPRWVVTCNFAEFYVYDMERPHGEPEIIKLADLEREYYRLQFLVDTTSEHIQREMEISFKAGEIVGLLYDAFSKQYHNPESPETLKSLNKLCVRLVFCLYAEDAGLFGSRLMFHDYMTQFSTRDMRMGLVKLFRVLNQRPEERDVYLAQDDPLLAAFPYVNGGLFSGDDIEIPPFTDEIRDLLLTKASADFDWSEISPTIFGAVFESTLNPETRRSGGMHYTSIENIHKVIDPLFLDDLKAELAAIKEIAIVRTRNQRLKAFQEKLGKLTFLDPAAGSGNFLTETYLSLRKLENETIKTWMTNTMVGLGTEETDYIKVSIGQFYGIEINDFAVTVAKTALWIAESQMLKQTEQILQMDLEFLPLKSYANIVEGNALRLDWESVVPKAKLNYIMGNPPFIGATMMNETQKKEAVSIFGKIKLSNSIDYVGAWYYKAAELMQGTSIVAAFVSTNSITQGEQVAPLWTTLLKKYSVSILFAYRTFIWNSEAKDKAAVHCVIIGFTTASTNKEKVIFEGGKLIKARAINPYLIDAPNVLIENRSKPLCDVPNMLLGNKPSDGGNLILSSEERNDIISREPALERFIHPYIGAVEFINKKDRYCFWLVGASPAELRSSEIIRERLKAVKKMREESSAAPTRLKAATPHLFFFISQPTTDYLLVPSTSSVNRRYVPIGFMSPDVIASNAATIVPNATLYHFGIITSNVHMAWLRTVGGRLKSDYRYSNGIVYNNFPWPTPTEAQRIKIEHTAQGILDARALYPDCSLADLYDDLAMPPELRTAHQRNDRAVMEAYGFWGKLNSESACVAELMKMYQKMTEQ